MHNNTAVQTRSQGQKVIYDDDDDDESISLSVYSEISGQQFFADSNVS